VQGSELQETTRISGAPADASHCAHMRAVAIAPWVIRWGPDDWEDMLRRNGRRAECGAKSVALQHSSWGGSDTGWAPMPIDQIAPVPREK